MENKMENEMEAIGIIRGLYKGSPSCAVQISVGLRL